MVTIQRQSTPEVLEKHFLETEIQIQRLEEKVSSSISNEEAYRKGFEENHGRYLVAGAVYRRSILSRIHYTVFSISVAALLMSFCQTALLSVDDLSLLFITIYWGALHVGVICAAVTTCWIQQRFTRIFTALGKDIFTYNTIDGDTALELFEVHNQLIKEKTFLKEAFAVMGKCCFFGYAFILPVIAMYNGKFFEPQKSTGVVDGLPWVVWIPFKVEDGNIILARIVMMLAEFYIAWTDINMIFGLVSFSICVGHTLLYEFKIVALAFKTFDKRAKWSRGRKSAIAVNQSTGEAMKKYLEISLEEAILHHEVLLEIVDDYVEIFRILILLFLLLNTVMICMSAVSLYSDIALEAKILFLLFTLSEMSICFILCYYGQVLLDAHELIGNAMYESNWTVYSSLIGRHVIIILTIIQKPLSLTAGGFADVNLDTFSEVMKTSFSYFSILQALK